MVLSSVGKGRGRGIENFEFFYLMYWKKQGRGIENWDFSIPFSYTGTIRLIVLKSKKQHVKNDLILVC